MNFRRLVLNLQGPVLVAVAVTVAVLTPHSKAQILQEGNYSAVVCPGALGGAQQDISLPSKGVLTRPLAGANQSLRVAKLTVLKGVVNPILIGGNPGSEIAFNTIARSSTADAVCQVGGIDQWFIGGSGGVTSQGVLEIINSGLSDSTVEIFPYNSKGALAPQAVNVRANSAQRLALATIAPGNESVAFHVVTESGRVSSFLLDHRKSGLKEQGSSFVTPVGAPERESYIAGIVGSAPKVTSFMRFLVPGDISATVHLTIYSNGGKFTPLGFDSISIAHQRVVDLALPDFALSSPFGIEISSDQPILAAVLTKRTLGGVDFAWANQLTSLSNFSVNFAGTRAEFLFLGKSVAIRARWRDAKGRSNSVVLSGESTALFRPVGALTGITFTLLTHEPIYGGAIVTNVDGGLNYLPLLANHLSSQARAPIADLRTLTRH